MIDYIKLNTHGIKKVFYLDSVDSTNKFAKEEVTDDNVLIVAGYQLKGRGRFDRLWESDKGKNVTITLVKNLNITKVHLVNFYTSYIILRALKEVTSFEATGSEGLFKLKWPNDVLLNGKKIAGVLTELVNINDNPKKFIIGIGINVNQDNFSDELLKKAASLRNFFKKEFVINDVINSIVKSFYENMLLLDQANILMELWRLNTDIFGKEVKFRLAENKEEMRGEVLEIADDGGIKIKVSDNNNSKNISTFYTGEISFIY
ncbi:MAG: biotin--[acetyl-CoA-carboxylase] ligase [Ignavibacteria bacterium]|nr:biotin--[acetyl-CoA-carboxylase] ligase [Ignavibacteria bacterium]